MILISSDVPCPPTPASRFPGPCDAIDPAAKDSLSPGRKPNPTFPVTEPDSYDGGGTLPFGSAGSTVGQCDCGVAFRVHYKTFLRWKKAEGTNKDGDAKKARPPGRPPMPSCVEELILRFARENAWGYSRIRGELRKLGIIVARNTVKKILIKNGFHPSPNRATGGWERFLKRHMDTLSATDFFTKDVWTGFGKVTYYVLFFIHVGSRRVRVAG